MQQSREELNERLRTALEGFGGGFALMRAERRGEEVADWELLYANDYVRERWLGRLPDPGSRMSVVTDIGASDPFGPLQRAGCRVAGCRALDRLGP